MKAAGTLQEQAKIKQQDTTALGQMSQNREILQAAAQAGKIKELAGHTEILE